MVLELLAAVGFVLLSPFNAHIPVVIGGYGDVVSYPQTIVVNSDLVASGHTDYYSIDLTDTTDDTIFVFGVNESAIVFPYSFEVYYSNRTYSVESVTFACVRDDYAGDWHGLQFGGNRGMPFYYWNGQYRYVRAYGEIWSMPYGAQWTYFNTNIAIGMEGFDYNYASYSSTNNTSTQFVLSTNIFYNWCDTFVGDYLFAYQNAYVAGYQHGETVGWHTGMNQGQEEVYQRGYNEGYATGYEAGLHDNTNNAVVSNLFGAVVAIPINILNGLSPLVIWDTPIISIIITLMFVALILWIIKRFI